MSEKNAKMLSFVGGLLFFSVVAASLLRNDDILRANLTEQAQGYLRISKEILRRASLVLSKAGAGVSESAKGNSNFKKGSVVAPADEYDRAWGQAEEQGAARLKRRSVP
ncbi:MAG: hypothetical protein LBL86_08835 [Coriobacteriales bacterium]|jgi:hypothetical protein|nr:hypothetical protein [Coriobacteriales bacterium]